MRVAVVDIGTNSTRLYIADVQGGQIAAELDRRTTITRLGAGVDADGSLRDDAIARVLAAVDEYQTSIDGHGCDTRLAVLTSAVRDAANGAQFADTVEHRYGLTTKVLSGDEEATLTFMGATSERDQADRTPTLVVDIGGGSTELVIGAAGQPAFHVSTQAGVVRQTERHLASDPPTEKQIDQLRRDVREIIAAGVPREHRGSVAQAIAVAGTATSLAAIAQQLEPYDADKVQGYRLTREQCDQLLARLAALTVAQRREVTGLHPDRAPTIVAGAAILAEVLALFELQSVEVSEHDILRGAAIGLTGS